MSMKQILITVPSAILNTYLIPSSLFTPTGQPLSLLTWISATTLNCLYLEFHLATFHHCQKNNNPFDIKILCHLSAESPFDKIQAP